MVCQDRQHELLRVVGHRQRRAALEVLEERIEEVVDLQRKVLEVGREVAVEDGVQHQHMVVFEKLEPGKVNMPRLAQHPLDARRAGADDRAQGRRMHRRGLAHPHHHVQGLLREALVAPVAHRVGLAGIAPALDQALGLAVAGIERLGQAGQAKHIAHHALDHAAREGRAQAPVQAGGLPLVQAEHQGVAACRIAFVGNGGTHAQDAVSAVGNRPDLLPRAPRQKGRRRVGAQGRGDVRFPQRPQQPALRGLAARRKGGVARRVQQPGCAQQVLERDAHPRLDVAHHAGQCAHHQRRATRAVERTFANRECLEHRVEHRQAVTAAFQPLRPTLFLERVVLHQLPCPRRQAGQGSLARGHTARLEDEVAREHLQVHAAVGVRHGLAEQRQVGGGEAEQHLPETQRGVFGVLRQIEFVATEQRRLRGGCCPAGDAMQVGVERPEGIVQRLLLCLVHRLVVPARVQREQEAPAADAGVRCVRKSRAVGEGLADECFARDEIDLARDLRPGRRHRALFVMAGEALELEDPAVAGSDLFVQRRTLGVVAQPLEDLARELMRGRSCLIQRRQVGWWGLRPSVHALVLPQRCLPSRRIRASRARP